jgi:bacteriocin biosynthesis cyclodehydratase domain-containing protein
MLSVGAFGQAVAASLKELLPNVIETRLESPEQTHPMFWPAARVHLLAAWRPVAKLSRLLDEMSHAWRAPFIEAVLETPHLRIGPVVVPGASACHGCFEQRTLQHAPRPDKHQILRDFYDAQPQQGPQGYLSAFAEIAAIRLAQLVRQLERDPDTAAGQVWQMNTINRDTVCGRVVGVHGCPRCGLRRDEATRSFATLGREMAALIWQSRVTAKLAIKSGVIVPRTPNVEDDLENRATAELVARA